MLKRLTNNWALKLTALVLSIALWSHVRGQVNPWETASFKVRLNATPPRGFVLQDSERLPRTVVVALRGPRLTLRGLKGGTPTNPLATGDEATVLTSQQLQANLDFTSPKPGLQRVTVKVPSAWEDIEVIGIKPLEIPVTLDMAATKKVDVEVEFDLPRDWRAVDRRPSTPTVEIAGASQVLDRVAKVRALVKASVTAPGEMASERVPLTALDEAGQPVAEVSLEPAQVRVRAKIIERLEQKILPVKITVKGEPASGYVLEALEVEPSALRVRGPRRVLKTLDSLQATLDIAGARSTRSRRIRLNAPASIDFVDTSRVLVRARISAEPAPVSVTPPVRRETQALENERQPDLAKESTPAPPAPAP